MEAIMDNGNATGARHVDDSLIAHIAGRIAETFHPSRIILFGSRARGDNREDSDIDILVEMESSENRIELRRKIARLFLDRWWAMDILVYTPKEIADWKYSLATILPDIESEGKVLYSVADA